MQASMLLYVYGCFALLTGAFFFFNVYHIAKFGVGGWSTKAVLTFYVLTFVLALSAGAFVLSTVDWSEDIELDLQFELINGERILPL